MTFWKIMDSCIAILHGRFCGLRYLTVCNLNRLQNYYNYHHLIKFISFVSQILNWILCKYLPHTNKGDSNPIRKFTTLIDYPEYWIHSHYNITFCILIVFNLLHSNMILDISESIFGFSYWKVTLFIIPSTRTRYSNTPGAGYRKYHTLNCTPLSVMHAHNKGCCWGSH